MSSRSSSDNYYISSILSWLQYTVLLHGVPSVESKLRVKATGGFVLYIVFQAKYLSFISILSFRNIVIFCNDDNNNMSNNEWQLCKECIEIKPNIILTYSICTLTLSFTCDISIADLSVSCWDIWIRSQRSWNPYAVNLAKQPTTAHLRFINIVPVIQVSFWEWRQPSLSPLPGSIPIHRLVLSKFLLTIIIVIIKPESLTLSLQLSLFPPFILVLDRSTSNSPSLVLFNGANSNPIQSNLHFRFHLHHCCLRLKLWLPMLLLVVVPWLLSVRTVGWTKWGRAISERRGEVILCSMRRPWYHTVF